MSHALLLRLFLSPSFFSVYVALQYLALYADNIGITYYLTRRLREFNTRELEKVWGFICHLLVTRPSKSRALECFVVECAQRSTHIAMITLWSMQASLKDLASSNTATQSFAICQRTLHRCHEIIFGDLPSAGSIPYADMSLPYEARLVRKKVRAHAEPVFVGLGLLAAAIASPQLVNVMDEVVIEQGRLDDEGRELKSVEEQDDIVAGSPAPTGQKLLVGLGYENGQDGQDDDEEPVTASPVLAQDDGTVLAGNNDFTKTKIDLLMRRGVHAAQTSPVLPVHIRNTDKPRLSDDPLGQREMASSLPNPFQSSPLISVSRQHRSINSNTLDEALQKYDFQSQMHMLRSHYCYSEVQFLLALEIISHRLLVIPRPARVSALRAELTALNHKLPAELCIPMWCSSSDTPRPPTKIPEPHHRIVRIPPGECVVLNSAQHAPYLLLVEILNGDLDFDPAKRNNRDVLRKMVSKESHKKGGFRDLIHFTSHVHHRNVMSEPIAASDLVMGDNGVENGETQSARVSSAEPAIDPPSDADDEEMDLVEQVYGTEEPLRSKPINLSDSIVLPPAPKNKELDMVTWSRKSSLPSSPAIDRSSSFTVTSPSTPMNHTPALLQYGHTEETGPQTEEIGTVLSLDEYSERMRTAAIMLAQLNANLVREAVTSVTPSTRSPLPGESSSPALQRRSSQPDHSLDRLTTAGPIHPSLSGDVVGTSSAPQTRMKISYWEAAAIRDRIMKEMMALEEERMERMRENREGEGLLRLGDVRDGVKTAEDEKIIRRELNKSDPSAIVFSESWSAKKSRIRHSSPYGHLANWDCVSVIVKTGGDLRQEQLGVQLIQEFHRIWQEEKCHCWLRCFSILITGPNSGLVETVTDAVSIHSIKKAEYARRLTEGRLGYVTLLDHFKSVYGDPSSAKFTRAQQNFAKSLAGYSVVSYLLQIKDRHNGNILLDREGHLIHIDFGFMLSNSPGNIGFEAAPFKLPLEYVEILGGVEGKPFLEFKRLFKEGFIAARKNSDRILTLVELMQKDSSLPCFAAFGEQTAEQLRDRFQPTLTQVLIGEHIDRLVESSLGSNWTRLYDSYQYYSQSIL